MHQKEILDDGFSLIELLITMAIIGILAMIALPSYQNYVRQARRAEAQSILLDLQQREEKWRVNNTTYGTLTEIGGQAANDYYTFTVSNNTATTYTITATATGAQSSDTGCTTMSIDASGTKTPAACWKK